MFEPRETTTYATVAEVTINNASMSNTTTLTYQIKQPNEYLNDFMVSLRASEIKKVRGLCDDAKKSSFPWNEILLAIATTFLGCILGALVSNIQLNSLKGIIIYILGGVIASGTLVAYFFVRKNAIDDINRLADNIKEYIVDPDNM
ncbi:hypothetical protein LIZ77_05480 [Clostridium perfringens]|uniref:hypothetical protein n=1 Tax=Clostridium perfringens TaxID=1502 RepID=UPI001A245FD7|nr:hypothetical protein [Clostridium perfringens]MCX0370221.1 hypothetical protein [Clostridium perfringens]HAT4245993.1 hypothetical protein [Clostridium perfringens]